jgi:hypothetical protein
MINFAALHPDLMLHRNIGRLAFGLRKAAERGGAIVRQCSQGVSGGKAGPAPILERWWENAKSAHSSTSAIHPGASTTRHGLRLNGILLRCGIEFRD